MRKPSFIIVLLIITPAVALLLLSVAVAKPLPELALTGIEPSSLVSQKGGALSVYGNDFTTATVVRVVGHGLLDTTYVNSEALQAAVPPGVRPGTYDIQVAETGISATLPAALTIVAATPTPGPTPAPTPNPTPVPGQPNITILNYSTDPARVVAGRKFVVTVEIYNNGSRAGENTLVTFPGGTFVPQGQTGHLLWQLHINHKAVVTQGMRAPNGLVSGTYNLQIKVSANDYEGRHFEFPDTVAVEVTGVGHGRPQLVIEKARTQPPSLGPGDAFSLTLQLANQGNRTATGVVVGTASIDLAVPADGGNETALNAIGIGQRTTVTLPLVLAETAAGGRQGLGISLDYGDYQGATYADQQNVGLAVVTALVDRPQLVVDDYHTTPDTLRPGDALTLTVRVTNVGGGEAERLLLTLGGEGAADLGPFAPLRSSNVKFVSQVNAGGTIEVTQPLVVDGSAQSGSYGLQLALAYDDARGTRHTDSQLISLLVRRRPHFQIDYYRPVGMPTVGQPFPIPVEATNVGRTLVNVSTLELTSEDLEIEAGSLFVGPLDGGTSASLEATAIAHDAGTAEVMVSVHYLDDFDQRQAVTQTLTVEVEEPRITTPEADAEPPEQEAGLLGRVWAFLRALLGLGS